MFNKKANALKRIGDALETLLRREYPIEFQYKGFRSPNHAIISYLDEISASLKVMRETDSGIHGVSCFNPPMPIIIETDIECFKSHKRMGQDALLIALDFRSGEKWPVGWVRYEDGKMGFISPDLFRIKE